MTTGTLTELDGRPALRFVRQLPHAVDRVWRAVSDPAELTSWFVATVAWTPAEGESFDVMGIPLQITTVDPPHLLAWSWGDERYRFELTERPGDTPGCTLVFVHAFNPDLGPAAQHAAGWEGYLDRLDVHLDGGELSELDAHDQIAERHEQYAAAFGEDPAPGRAGIAGMSFRDLTLDGLVLRLERRYHHPIERVWRAITDPDELTQWFPSGEPLVVTTRTEPTLLAGTWFGEPVRIELHPDPVGCRLVFTHEIGERAVAARTAAGWDRCFARFDAALAGHPMSERDALVAWPDVHERYATTFEVDPELGRAAFAAHPLT